MPDYQTQPLIVEAEPVQPSVSPGKAGGRVALGTVVLVLAAVVAVGGVAFAVGRVTAPQTAAASTGGFRNGFGGGTENGTGTGRGFFGGTGTGGFGGGAFRGLGVTGTVTAVNPTSISIQLTNGTTIDIPTDSSTTYHTQQPGSASDVQVGKQVQIQLQRPTTTGGAAPSPGASGAPNLGTASSVTVLGN